MLVYIRQSFNCRFGQYVAEVWAAGGLASVRETQGYNVLTEVVFPVLRLS